MLEPIFIPRVLNTGTCIEQGDLSYSAGLHRNRCALQVTPEKNSGEVLAKMQVNGPERQKLARKKSMAVSVACKAKY